MTSNIFSLKTSEQNAKLVYIPVPFEATTSYGTGTVNGPEAILKASLQIDLYDHECGDISKHGLHLLEEHTTLRKNSDKAKVHAKRVVDCIEQNKTPNQSDIQVVNDLSEQMNEFVYNETKRLLEVNKQVGIIGGDHSVPSGAIKAIAEKQKDFGVLHFDAHMDFRQAYQGFTYSHASIMYNVLENIPQVSRITQVGIRDFCEEELAFATSKKNRVNTFFDTELSKRIYCGESWDKICDDIVNTLPQNVWISFDIDGLDPRFCPSTGTPVPGGLDFNQATYLIGKVAKSGRKIIGFDLSEVSPSPDPTNEWDANVGMRLLYKLSGWLLEG